MAVQQEFVDAFGAARRSAVHLEMRDSYAVDEETGQYAAWKAGNRDLDPDSEYWAPWTNLVRDAVGRGVVVRRARIVSEPASAYVRFEHSGTPVNIAAGELVRWLPRRDSIGIAVPTADYWVFDDTTVLLNHFTGDGGWDGIETRTDPAVVKLCAEAFESVWDRATPHADYPL
jgi:hypothetical protein